MQGKKKSRLILPFTIIFEIILWKCLFRWPFTYVIAPACNWIAVHIGLKSIPKTTGIIIIFATVTLLFYGLAFVIPYILSTQTLEGEEISYSQVIARAINKELGEKVTISQKQEWLIPNKRYAIVQIKVDAKPAWALIEPQGDAGSAEWFRLHGYDVWMESPFPFAYMLFFGLQMFPNVLLGIFFIWMWFGGGMGMMMGEWSSIKYSKMKRGPPVTFDEVGGLKNAKKECEVFVEFLEDPRPFKKKRAHMPKGILIVGDPGIGKTLLARAIASRAGVPDYPISGADFDQPLMGLGPKTVHDLFDHAERNAPSVIIIDEADSALSSRARRSPLESSGRSAITNTLLNRLQSISDRDLPVLVIAITNLEAELDEAATRPGRFDHRIVVGSPDFEGRREILHIHLTKPTPVPLDPRVNMRELEEELADLTANVKFVGVTLKTLVNEAAINSVRKKREFVTRQDFYDVLPRVLTRSQESDITLSEHEQELVAWHDMAHAYVSWLLKDAIPARIVFIEGHEHAGAMTITPTDVRIFSRKQLFARIKVALAGYVIEKIKYGEPSTGPSTDLNTATRIANMMVSSLGMSSLGAISIDALSETRYGALAIQTQSKLTEMRDEKVREIVDNCAEELTRLIGEKDGPHMKKMETLVTTLRAEKILAGKRLEQLFSDMERV